MFFEFELTQKDDLEFGYIYCPIETELLENNFFIIYTNLFNAIFYFIIPFIGVAFLNAKIYRQVREANQKRTQLTQNEKLENELSKMLFAIVIAFFCCYVLEAVIGILVCISDEEGNSAIDIDIRLIHVSNLLVTANSSVNCIFYVMLGRKFKKEFLSMFCNCKVKCHRQDRDTSESLEMTEKSQWSTLNALISHKFHH